MAQGSLSSRHAAWAIGGAGLVAACAVATPALAANKSLPVAVASLPADVTVVASLDAAIARSTKLYSSTIPTLLSMSGKQTGLDDIKKTCGFDPITAIDDVTLAIDANKDGAAFIGVNITESSFTSCLVSIAKQKGETLTTSKSGNEYTVTTSKGTFYFAWLTGGVLAITRDPKDEPLLARFTGGAGALATNKAMTSWIGMADPNALAMVATTRSFSQSGLSLDGGVASIVYKSGSFDAKVTIEVGSQSKAEMIEKGAGALKNLATGRGPTELQNILGTVDVKASGTKVVAKASGTETEVTAVVGWLVKGMP
ncbi:MAG: hypothetical protein U0414_41505 [Polyangiaceae bacterium]